MEKVKELIDFSLDQASLEIYWITPKGKFVYTNETAQECLGYSEKELEEMHVWDVDPNHGEEIREQRWQKLKKEGSMTFESEHKTKDGEIYPVEITNHYIEFEDEEYEFAFVKDITKRKKAEKELLRSEEKKDFLNALIRQDLGSKTQTSLAYLQLLEDSDIPDEKEEYLKKAIEAGRESGEILDLATKLEEIENTEWVAEKDIVKVLDHVLEDMSDLIKRRNVRIKKNYPDTISRALGDYSLKILFLQILKTRIQTCECDLINLDLEEKSDEILLKIEDNGLDLPEDVVGLFTGEVYTGETSGVGGVRYYMIREIADHNNAEIEIKDSELGGARFDVHLNKVQ